MINLFTYALHSWKKTAQLIHLTIDLSRLHKNLNSGKFEYKICVNLHHYNNRFIIFHLRPAFLLWFMDAICNEKDFRLGQLSIWD